MEGLEPLRVWIGATRFPEGVRQPTLVVNAEADQLEALRKQLDQSLGSRDVILRHALLGANTDTKLAWFRFNDARFNGVVPLTRWQVIYPNLQLTDEQTFSAQTLANILDDWPATGDDQRSIELTISQGDPLQVLIGAKGWWHRIQRIQLTGMRAEALWGETFYPWLVQHGFRQDSQNSACWSLEPMAALALRQRIDIERLQLQREHDIQEWAIRESKILAALQHVFPYAAYREKRPDLYGFSDPQLLEHFLNTGIYEGVELYFSTVHSELQQLKSDRSTQAARASLLNEKSSHTAQQLEILKDLFSRLIVNS